MSISNSIINKPIKYNQVLYIYLILTGLSHTLPAINFIKPILMITVLLLFFYSIYYSNTVSHYKTLIILLFSGFEPITYVIPFILLPLLIKQLISFCKKPFLQRNKILFFVFILYSIILLFYGNSVDYSFTSIALWILVSFSPFIIGLYYQHQKIKNHELQQLFDFFKNVLILEISILLLQFLVHKNIFPGDHWNGSYNDANKAGCYIVIYMFWVFFDVIYLKKKNLKQLFLILIPGAFLYLTDSKIIILSFIFGFVFLNLLLVCSGTYLKKLNIKPLLPVTILIAFIFSTSTIITYANYYLKNTANTNINKVIQQYITVHNNNSLKGMNNKYILYNDVFVQMKKQNTANWFLGVGAGKFGSRSSNMLAYDILYKQDGSFKLPSFIKPYSSKWTKKYLKGKLTKEVYAGTKWMSANLSMAVAGWATIKMEYGLLGIVLFVSFILQFVIQLLFFSNGYFATEKLLMALFGLSFIFLMLFDNYQEKPGIFLVFLVFTVLLSNVVPDENTNI